MSYALCFVEASVAHRGDESHELVRVERNPRRVPGHVVELPQRGVAPVPVVRGDVLDLLRRAL